MSKKSKEKTLTEKNLKGIIENLSDLNRHTGAKKPSKEDLPEPKSNRLKDKAKYLD